MRNKDIITVFSCDGEFSARSLVWGDLDETTYANYLRNLQAGAYIIRFGTIEKISENVTKMDVFVR